MLFVTAIESNAGVTGGRHISIPTTERPVYQEAIVWEGVAAVRIWFSPSTVTIWRNDG